MQDPLLSLRRAIASDSLPTPTTTADLTTDTATDNLATATHLYFQHPVPQTQPLSIPTRFVSAATDTSVDLRSIFFAWQKKDVAIPEYIASATELNAALAATGRRDESTGAEEKVLNLVFVERLDLITWLEGASDESEYIKPLEGAAAAAAAQADAAAAAVPTAPGPAAGGAVAGGKAKAVDPLLQMVYDGERKLGDRNSVLRGIKPTVLSFPPSPCLQSRQTR